MKPVPDAVVLVTGASSGIGLATAVAAARAGFTAVAGVRDPAGATALRETGIDVRKLDVTDAASVAACVEGVVATHGRLDALVNNAGVASAAFTLELSSIDAVRASLEVNFFGVLTMTRAALPHLRAARGRLITVGSVRGVIGQPFNEAYSAAKFAVEGYLEGLAPTLAQLGVAVSVVEPAAVLDTSFVASSPLDPAALLAGAGPYEAAFRAYRGFVAGGAVEGAQTAAEVAAVILAALADPAPPFRIPTSAYAAAYLARKLSDVDGGGVQDLTRSWLT